MLHDAKSSHGLCPGELKIKRSNKHGIKLPVDYISKRVDWLVTDKVKCLFIYHTLSTSKGNKHFTCTQYL